MNNGWEMSYEENGERRNEEQILLLIGWILAIGDYLLNPITDGEGVFKTLVDFKVK